ncbi:MAG: hypothetical protein AAF081_11615 [Actinomycetota bacterium]
MAFGQSAGPAASHRQTAELLELLQNAGHADFKDARGPLGFNQRQAAGRFTADEAQELIDQLQQAEYEADQQAEATVAEPRPKEPKAKAEAKPKGMTDDERAEMERAVRSASTKSLVLELRRRGWVVTKPK